MRDRQYGPYGGSEGLFTSAVAFGLMCLVGAAPQLPEAKTIALLFGYHIGGMGLCFVFSEANNKNNAFLANSIRTDGTHALCRFPLYGGLVMCGIGASMVTTSWIRLAATMLLYVLLSYKARTEERKFQAMYGEEYWYWMANAPRLLPDFSDLERIKTALSSGRSFNEYGNNRDWARGDRYDRY